MRSVLELGDMKETLAVIAAVLAIIGNVPYLIDIVKGKTKPHPYTWLVWSVVSCIVFFGQLKSGGGVGSIPTAASEIFTILIFLFSLKYGFKGIKTVDTIFLVVALAGIIPWILTNDATLSVIIAVSIDLVAFVPTIRKTWREPATETPILYTMNIVRHVLALFALEAYNIATTLHSLAMIITNSAMTAIITLKRGAKAPK